MENNVVTKGMYSTQFTLYAYFYSFVRIILTYGFNFLHYFIIYLSEIMTGVQSIFSTEQYRLYSNLISNKNFSYRIKIKKNLK